MNSCVPLPSSPRSRAGRPASTLPRLDSGDPSMLSLSTMRGPSAFYGRTMPLGCVIAPQRGRNAREHFVVWPLLSAAPSRAAIGRLLETRERVDDQGNKQQDLVEDGNREERLRPP